MKVLEKLFGTHSEIEIKRLLPIVDEIDRLKPALKKMTDEQLKNQTVKFKDRLKKGETLDDILPEAFATVREAAYRTLGFYHHRCQLIGGIILHQGRITEMKTGEGKTLVSTLPAYLNALEGKGVHVVTVNDYLAERDAKIMAPVHKFLGLSVGVVLNEMLPEQRREAYNCDITYVTNNELGFDYLRDNMVSFVNERVQRGLHYAIIDEIDSVLIDEARTPLIISGQGQKSDSLYMACDTLARQLKQGKEKGKFGKLEAIAGEDVKETGDFIINQKEKSVRLTERGVKKTESFFKIDNLADMENVTIMHHIILALRANYLMKNNKDYIVSKENKVLIVDEFTGRILDGRRYSDGLHQAIEAKENVPILRENKTLATITFQNLFNSYAKKSGMTGTALSEEKEFRDIYSMDVVEVPTNKPVIRKDYDDVSFLTQKEKYQAVIKEIRKTHVSGQPVLVGTVSIADSERISRMLTKIGMKHNVLNAKHHELEAEIISRAGTFGAITIATNMAGRGTDIKLDDNAKAAGGLKVIGTEHHESKRIDDQLRGRSGRQGDPGESVFFISKNDSIAKQYGKGIDLNLKNMPKNMRIIQKKVEENNFGIRKNLLDYDQVINEQRKIIYDQRNAILDEENISDIIDSLIHDYAITIAEQYKCTEHTIDDFKQLNSNIAELIPSHRNLSMKFRNKKNIEKIIERVILTHYKSIEENTKKEEFHDLERVILLKVIDQQWVNHLDAMEHLREGIALQAYAQKDPLVEYKMIGYEYFDYTIRNIRNVVLKTIFLNGEKLM